MLRVLLRTSPLALAVLVGACSVLVPFDEYTGGRLATPDAAPIDAAASDWSSDGGREEAGPACGDVLASSRHCRRCDHDCRATPLAIVGDDVFFGSLRTDSTNV